LTRLCGVDAQIHRPRYANGVDKARVGNALAMVCSWIRRMPEVKHAKDAFDR
jgi:hypothetical protein